MKIRNIVVPASCCLLTASLLYGMRTINTPLIVEAQRNNTSNYAIYEDFRTDIEPMEVTYKVSVETEPAKHTYYDIPLTDSEQDEIRSICDEYGIDMELVLAICQTETGFNKESIGDHGESYGIMQIQPQWWSSYFYINGCSDWLSIHDNVTVGCEILRYLSDSYGDTRCVLNAYNSSNPNLNNGYADRVLANMEKLQERN